jgi:chromosome segregation protein
VYVEKVVLHNFKSFRGGTVAFEAGFNTVVGPNGSGKSNIIDALLFAFGENSLKSMRVKKTPDLIFGSQKMAEVAVTLNDRSGRRHEVRRLVRRDGKTKYLLDGKRVKKYVLEEFLATNSILLTNVIKQGEVQRIVEMNPKDRRTLIDNVANISEYESKKREALGELDKVEKRLGEASAILAERQGFLEQLEQEKKDAQRYVALDGEHKQLKATLLHLDARAFEKDYEELVTTSLERDAKLGAVMAKIQEQVQRIDSINAQKEEIAKHILSRGDGKAVQLEREITDLNSSVQRARELIEEKRQFLERSGPRVQELSLHSKRAADAVADTERHQKEVAEELAAQDHMLAREQAEHDALVSQSNAFTQGYHSARQQADQLEKEMLAAKERLAVVQAELGKNTEVHRLKANERERLARGRHEDLSPQLKEYKSKVAANQEQLEQVDKALAKLLKEEQELSERIPVVEDLILAHRSKLAELNARLKAASHTDQARALEAVLGLGLKGVHGTLETLCRYEQRYSVPVSTALGARSSYLVVDSAATAGKAIDYLKKNRLGRVSFIPLDRIRAAAPSKDDRDAAKAKGAKGFLLEYVEYDKKYSAAFEYAFSNTILFESMSALEPWVGKARGVTLEGELAEASGLLSGGTASLRPSLFKDKKDLEDFEAKLQKSLAEKEEVGRLLAELRERLLPVRRQRAELEVQAKANELEGRTLKVQEARALEAQRDITSALAKLDAELKDLLAATGSLEEERAGLIRRLSDLNLRLLEARQRIDLEKEQTLGARVKEREKRLSDLRISAAALRTRLEALDGERASRGREHDLIRGQLSELDTQVKESEAAIKHADATIKECLRLLRDKVAEQRKLEGAAKDLVEAREKLDKELTKAGNDKGRLEVERERLQGGQQELAVKKAVLEQKLVDLKAQLAEFQGVLVMEGAKLEDKPELAAKAKELESELKALGTVNLKAIEQYEQKLKDYGDQLQKVGQLRTEKDAILSVITEIDGRKVSTFMAAFNIVNANFQSLFTKIFKGTGTLFLENSEDPFAGGLTIQIQLENKEIKYLELMSGGEKSLIALLFLFSLQGFNPSGIAILDEADAALDQENSRKLSSLIGQLSKDSQFLVVTHNEAVYKQADTLVGVAMGRDGSKLVEVKLTGTPGGPAGPSASPAAPEAPQAPPGPPIVPPEVPLTPPTAAL